MSSKWVAKPLKHPLYERQQGETEQAFAAFCLYRDMGEERSHAKVGLQVGKNRALINRWGAIWGWTARVHAWDKELDRQGLAVVAKNRREMVERHVKQARAVQFKAIERLAEMASGELKPREILDYFIQGAKLERLSLGEPTESVEQRGDQETTGAIRDIAPLVKGASNEELEQLRKTFAGIAERLRQQSGNNSAGT